MPGLDFTGFLTLLIISVVVSGILHFGAKYYVLPGFWSFCSKVVVGYIGAWLGTPVIGRWWEGVNVGEVFLVPAILGSIALVVLAVDIAKMVTGDGGGAS
ncbi:MAG: hypothetical protein QGG17_02490 [Rhodospirillales bacterium]|jgi:uncharacterized membrane protein YeaQ/YmgE (transglycosylase-associated protein family)|nr:hypothetical protein [Rhodospirillales bacterium]MDP6805306.1 hypothetical protein [Rhodospirillales bacterium]